MARRKKEKKPKAGISPLQHRAPRIEPGLGQDPRKQPKHVPLLLLHEQSPAWRVSMMEMVDPFGWHSIDRETLHRIRERLGHFESMTWGEILVEGGKWNHPIPVSHICRDARNRLEVLKQEDTDYLLSLTVTGRERVWGIREGNVLRILWWDPYHAVCPSRKKHT